MLCCAVCLPFATPQLDTQQQPPASFEGGERRCFQTVFFCGRNIAMGQGWAPDEEAVTSEAEREAALAQQVPLEPYSYGQAVVQYMRQKQKQQQKRQQQRGQAAQAPVDGISLQAAAAEAAGAPPLAAVLPSTPRASTSGRLRILFMKRGSEGRQILNAGELLERCNAWRYQPPGGGPAVTASCSEVGRVGLRAGLAVACAAMRCIA